MSAYAKREKFYSGFDMEESCIYVDNKKIQDSRYSNIICKIDAIIDRLRDNPGCGVVSDVYDLFKTMTQHLIKENTFINMLDFPFARQHFENHSEIYSTVADLCFKCIIKQMVDPAELDNVRSIWVKHICHHDRLLEKYLLS